MKRSNFNQIALATVTSILLPVALVKSAEALPDEKIFAFGESRRFPGFLLRAYRDEAGEMYLSFDKKKLASEIAIPVHELETVNVDELISNAHEARYIGECDGNCVLLGIPDYESGGHDCFIVSNAIQDCIKAIDTRVAYTSANFHPQNVGLIDQIWTYYN